MNAANTSIVKLVSHARNFLHKGLCKNLRMTFKNLGRSLGRFFFVQHILNATNFSKSKERKKLNQNLK